MDLSIVIISYNSKEFIKRCLNSLLNSGANLEIETIVVDNGSQDGSVELLRADFAQVKLIQNEKNLGYPKACNRGIKEAKGRYIFILNSDTELSNGSLHRMIEFMDGNPRCGILGPKLLDEDGKIQLSCRSFPSYSTAFFNRYSLLTKYFPRSKYADKYLMTNSRHNAIQEVDWVSGAAMVFSRACLDRIGIFDENFFIYCEDVDICRRAKNNGWQVFYYPKLCFTHFIGGTLKRTSFRSIFWHHKSIWHYYKKHLKVNIVWDALVFAGVFMRFIFQSYLNLISKF